MPDPSMERNRQLKRMADAMEQQNKALAALNKNLVQIGVKAVPSLEALGKFFGEMNAHDEMMVSTGQMKLDEEEPTEKDEPRFTQYFMLPVSEASAMTAREAGYEAEYHQPGTFALKLPILVERMDPNVS